MEDCTTTALSATTPQNQCQSRRRGWLFAYVALAALAVSAVSVHYLDKRTFGLKLDRTKTYDLAVLDFQRSHKSLAEYVLSGNTDDIIRIYEQNRRGKQALEMLIARSRSEYERNALKRLLAQQTDWLEKVAKPVIEKRSMVDDGRLSLGDLSMAYFEKDPNSWDEQFEKNVATAGAYE